MASTYKLISKATVGSGGAATITLSSIPSTYTDLLIKYSLRATRAGTTFTQLGMKLNNSSTNYTTRTIGGDGSTVTSTNNTVGYFGYESSSINSVNSTGYVFSSGEIYIPNYTANGSKRASIDFSSENNAVSGNGILSSAGWSINDAITSITFNEPNSNTNFEQYSTVTIYGIKNS